MWRVADVGKCFCSAAAIGHYGPGPPLKLMELTPSCFSPQIGTAGGDPPPRAEVNTLSPPSCHLLSVREQ